MKKIKTNDEYLCKCDSGRYPCKYFFLASPKCNYLCTCGSWPSAQTLPQEREPRRTLYSSSAHSVTWIHVWSLSLIMSSLASSDHFKNTGPHKSSNAVFYLQLQKDIKIYFNQYLTAHDDALAVRKLGILNSDVPEVDFILTRKLLLRWNIAFNANEKIYYDETVLPQCDVCIKAIGHITLRSIVL